MMFGETSIEASGYGANMSALNELVDSRTQNKRPVKSMLAPLTS
jgi:hypothetical protein